jgi:hypothetical protein
MKEITVLILRVRTRLIGREQELHAADRLAQAAERVESRREREADAARREGLPVESRGPDE